MISILDYIIKKLADFILGITVNKIRVYFKLKNVFKKTNEDMINEISGEYKDKCEEIYSHFILDIFTYLHLKNFDSIIEEYIKPELKNRMDKYHIPNEIIDDVIRRYAELFYNNLKVEFPEEYQQLKPDAQSDLVQRNTLQSQTLIDYTLNISSTEDIDQYLKNNTFKPHINLDFFCVDDPIFKDRFAAALNSQVINIKSHNKEEALYCILNELNRINSKREVIIVNDQKTWKYFISHPHENCIYIPNFIDDEIPLIPNNTTIYIYNYNHPIFNNGREILELRPRRKQTVINCLEKAGMSWTQANDLVKKTHGMFVNIKTKLFINPKPRVLNWVSDNDKTNIILTALLINEWTNETADQYAIKKLCNVEYKDFINRLIPFITSDIPLVCKHKNRNLTTYYLADTEIAWAYLNNKLEFNISLWNQFVQLLEEVETGHSKIIKPENDSVEQSNVKSFSLNLRRGMLRSLLVGGIKFHNCYQYELDDLVKRILDDVKNEQQWIHILAVFKELCELSPKAVIQRLNMELQKNTGLMTIFEKQQDRYYNEKLIVSNVICGIYLIVREENYVDEAYTWLINIKNKNYNFSVQPDVDSCIEQILLSSYNFSAYDSSNMKIRAAKQLIQKANNAWNTLFKICYKSGILLYPVYPLVRGNDEANTCATAGDCLKTLNGYTHLLIDHMETNEEYCINMIQKFPLFSEQNKVRFIEKFKVVQEFFSDDDKLKIRDELLYLIYRHRVVTGIDNKLDDKALNTLEKLFLNMKFKIDEYQYAYLFEDRYRKILLHPHADKEEDYYQKNRDELETLIQKVLSSFKNNERNIYNLIKACANYQDTSLGLYLAKYFSSYKYDKDLFINMYRSKLSRKVALKYCEELIYHNGDTLLDILSDYRKMNIIDNDFMVHLYEINFFSCQGNKNAAIYQANEETKKLYWTKIFVRVIGDNYELALSECYKYGNINTYVLSLFFTCQDHDIGVSIYNWFIKILDFDEKDLRDNYSYEISELLKKISSLHITDSDQIKKLIRFEITFSSCLGWKNMCFCRADAIEKPDLYVYIIKEKEEYLRITNFDQEFLKKKELAYNIYNSLDFCPAEHDRVVDQGELKKWVETLKMLLQENHLEHLFKESLGHILSNAPAGTDGYKPCEAVRNIIDEYGDKDLINAYCMSIINKRELNVARFIDDIGTYEFAKEYHDCNDHFKNINPTIGKIYEKLYHYYVNESINDRKLLDNDF